MIKRYCDMCKKEVKDFASDKPSSGSLSDFWAKAKVKEVCEKCFIKIDKAIIKASVEQHKFFTKRLSELLKIEFDDETA